MRVNPETFVRGEKLTSAEAEKSLRCSVASRAYPQASPQVRISCMKTPIVSLVAAGLFLGLTMAQADEKTVSEKASEMWDQTKETAKEVGSAVADKTRETVSRIEDAIDKPDDDARKVEVQLNDSGAQMPKTLPPGKTAFVVKNTGKQKHNFEIKGGSLEKSFWFNLDPDQTKTMQVNLEPGTYEAVCTIDGHAGKEGTTQLTVK